MYWSLRTKTISGIALIEATLLIFLIFTTIRLFSDTLDENIEKRAETTANLFATTTKNALLSFDLASLQSDVDELMNNPDIVYVRVLNDNNEVYIEAGDPDALSRPYKRDSSVDRVTDDVYDSDASIAVGTTRYGSVQLGIDVHSVQSSVLKIRNWATSIAITELLLVGIFSYVLGTYLTSQLRSLHSAARKIHGAIESRQFDSIHVEVRGNDELAELATAFNELVDSLSNESTRREQVEEALKQLNRSLEKNVAERTAMLSQKNRLLESANKDLKEAQVQLLQAEKMASVGQLAAGVAHEINNPVGFVSSNMSTLGDYITVYQIIFAHVEKMMQTDSPQARQKALDDLNILFEQHDIHFINEDLTSLIEESSEGLMRVAEIVKGLKMFSRIDSDEKQLFDINECLRATLSMVNNKLKYVCKVQLHLTEIPKVWLNVGKITQVFTNLLLNAAQAIESTEKFGTITISSGVQDDTLFVRICDTGSGIKPEHMDKLFNPFFTTKPEGQGTGLGLSISYGIAQEHGGYIEATSASGKGSCFTLSLPLTAEAKE